MTINDNDTHLNRIAREHAERGVIHRDQALHYMDESTTVDAIWAPIYVARAQVHATLALAEWTAARAETRR